MNILVTGGSGFIGSSFLEKLKFLPNINIYSLKRVSDLVKSKNIIEIKADLSSLNWIKSLPKNIDTVIHLAQSKEYKDFPKSADDIYAVNLNSTFQLLEWSRKNNVKKFIFASTGNVYKQKKGSLKESDLCQPEGFYASSKYSAELLCKEYQSFFDVAIVRFFGIYGPGQNKTLIPNLVNTIMEDKKIRLASGIGIYLTPLFIDDCTNMLITITKNLRLLNHYQIFNLAGDESLSLKRIAEVIGKKLKKQISFSLTKEEPRNLRGNNSLFKSLFKYNSPQTPFSKGIEKSI